MGEKAQGSKKILAALNTAWREVQVWDILVAGLVDAFDAENAGNLADIDENGFELAPVGNFEVGINARVGAIGAAFEVVNVGTGSLMTAVMSARRPARSRARMVSWTGKLGFGSAAPLDGDAAFGLVHEILHVGTRPGVHGDPRPRVM